MRAVCILALIIAVCMCTDLDAATESDENRSEYHCHHFDSKSTARDDLQKSGNCRKDVAGCVSESVFEREYVSRRTRERGKEGRTEQNEGKSADINKQMVERRDWTGGPRMRSLRKQSGNSQGGVSDHVWENKEEEKGERKRKRREGEGERRRKEKKRERKRERERKKKEGEEAGEEYRHEYE
jgi:hypothetical protein